MKQSNSKILYIGTILMILAAVALDQLTKYLAVIYLKGKDPYVIWEGVFELRYLENRGAAFGILQNQKWFFLVSGILILLLAGYIFVHMPHFGKFIPLRISCVFIMAGAIGNMIDRIVHQYVIDFFYFRLIDFPIFNVADIYVTVTTVLILLLVLFYYKEEDLEELFSVFSRRKKDDRAHE